MDDAADKPRFVDTDELRAALGDVPRIDAERFQADLDEHLDQTPLSRVYYPEGSGDEWIDLDRLREIIKEIESLGSTRITAVDLLNRLGIEDDELDLLKSLRRFLEASGAAPFIPGAPGPHAPGRRRARPKGDPASGS